MMSESQKNEFEKWEKSGNHEVMLRPSNWCSMRHIFNFECCTLSVTREKGVAVVPFNQLDRVAVDHARKALEQLGGSDPHQVQRPQGRPVRSL